MRSSSRSVLTDVRRRSTADIDVIGPVPKVRHALSRPARSALDACDNSNRGLAVAAGCDHTGVPVTTVSILFIYSYNSTMCV